MKSVPVKRPTTGPSWIQSPSVKIEEIFDQEDFLLSVPPHNPQNILKAANESNDEVLLGNNHPALSKSTMDVDDKMVVDDDMESPEEIDEAELSLFLVVWLQRNANIPPEHLMNEWTSPIYVFFKQTTHIEYVMDCWTHVFECAAGQYKGKNGRDICHFLEKVNLFFSWGMPNIATVIPAMDHIDSQLATNVINNKYPIAIKAALTIGKKTLNWYYDKTDHSKYFKLQWVCILTFYFSITFQWPSTSTSPSPQTPVIWKCWLGRRLDQDS